MARRWAIVSIGSLGVAVVLTTLRWALLGWEPDGMGVTLAVAVVMLAAGWIAAGFIHAGHRRREPPPEVPSGVRLVYRDGRERPLTLFYRGRDRSTGRDHWEVVEDVVGDLMNGSARLVADTLPPGTGIVEVIGRARPIDELD